MPTGSDDATVRAMAELVAAAIPHHTRIDWMNEGIMPDIGGRGPRCPRCGRHVPCSVGQQAGQEGDWIPMSRRELIAGCLVDGPRVARALPCTPHEIVAAVDTVADGAERQAWKATARFLRRALKSADANDARVEAGGQALEAVRAYGLFTVVMMRTSSDHHPEIHDAAVAGQHALDVLVASSGAYWPTDAVR
jgi:hypothetical protein